MDDDAGGLERLDTFEWRVGRVGEIDAVGMRNHVQSSLVELLPSRNQDDRA